MTYFHRQFAKVYWFYNSSEKTKDVPYMRTLFTILLLGILQFFQIVLLFELNSTELLPWASTDNKAIQYLKGMVALAILTTLLSLIFRKKDIVKITVTDDQIDSTKRFLLWYFILSLFFLSLLFFMYKGNTL
jgi:hypothetical protein